MALRTHAPPTVPDRTGPLRRSRRRGPSRIVAGEASASAWSHHRAAPHQPGVHRPRDLDDRVRSHHRPHLPAVLSPPRPAGGVRADADVLRGDPVRWPGRRCGQLRPGPARRRTPLPGPGDGDDERRGAAGLRRVHPGLERLRSGALRARRRFRRRGRRHGPCVQQPDPDARQEPLGGDRDARLQRRPVPGVRARRAGFGGTRRPAPAHGIRRRCHARRSRGRAGPAGEPRRPRPRGPRRQRPRAARDPPRPDRAPAGRGAGAHRGLGPRGRRRPGDPRRPGRVQEHPAGRDRPRHDGQPSSATTSSWSITSGSISASP